MRTLLQWKMSHICDAKAAREFRKRNSLFSDIKKGVPGMSRTVTESSVDAFSILFQADPLFLRTCSFYSVFSFTRFSVRLPDPSLLPP